MNKFNSVYDFSEQENPEQEHFNILPDDKFEMLSLDHSIASGENEHLYDSYPLYLKTQFTNEGIINLIMNSFKGTESGVGILKQVTINQNNIYPLYTEVETKVKTGDDILINEEPITFTANNNNANTIVWNDYNEHQNKDYTNQDMRSSMNISNQNTHNEINMNNINISMQQSQNFVQPIQEILDDDEQEALRQTQIFNDKRLKKLKEKMELELQQKKDNISKANDYLEKWIT